MYRDSLFYLNFTSKTQKCTISLLLRPLLTITDLKKFGMPNFGHSKFLPVFLYQKGFNKFGMHILGHSEFIPVFLGKFVRTNLEWPFLAILNLYQSFWKKLLENIQNGHSKFVPVFFGKIVRKNLEWPFLAILNLYQSFWEKLSEKFGTAIFGHSKFIPVFLGKIV